MDLERIEKAKTALIQVKKLNCRILEICDRIDFYREEAMRITQTYSAIRNRTDDGLSRVEAGAIEALDLCKKLMEHVEELKAKLKIVTDVIFRMEDEDEKRVLELRYLDGHSWDEICLKVYCSHSKVFMIHRRALENFTVKYMEIMGSESSR